MTCRNPLRSTVTAVVSASALVILFAVAGSAASPEAVAVENAAAGNMAVAVAPMQAPAALTVAPQSPIPAQILPAQILVEPWIRAIEAKLIQVETNPPPQAPMVGTGNGLKLGASGERVDRLAAALALRGFLAAGVYRGHFDAVFELAVREFQASEGLTVDGRAGEATIEAIDRSVAVTVQALRTTLAELRALDPETTSKLLLVNIPSQTAWLVRGGEVAMTMRVAVGRPSRPTPLLRDQITDVILNPTWTAPITVLSQDKLPALRQSGHPGIEGATIWLDGQEVDPVTVDWSAVTPERVRIVQSPGDQNALGRFKFNMTNGESIYLHDTNDHSVFERQNRAISSGCVRLAAPRRLAETLLEREGWSPERISRAVDGGRTLGIRLHKPLMVRLVYWLATVDDTGNVRIHRDVYRKVTPGAVPTAADVRLARPKVASVSSVSVAPMLPVPASMAPRLVQDSDVTGVARQPAEGAGIWRRSGFSVPPVNSNGSASP
ncbi:L,D-transpeptidase YcbB [uncultured Gammaproteobacteria bacterium]